MRICPPRSWIAADGAVRSGRTAISMFLPIPFPSPIATSPNCASARRLPIGVRSARACRSTTAGAGLGAGDRRVGCRPVESPPRRSMGRVSRMAHRPERRSAGRFARVRRRPRVRRAVAPVVLTHDIDSPEGLKNLRLAFPAAEEAVGARSTSYIVPCAWRLDHGLIAELVARGHEVGVHGYDHSNRTPFAASDERRRRLDRRASFAERYGAAGLSRAVALAHARPAARSRRTLSVRQQHSHVAAGCFRCPTTAAPRPVLSRRRRSASCR